MVLYWLILRDFWGICWLKTGPPGMILPLLLFYENLGIFTSESGINLFYSYLYGLKLLVFIPKVEVAIVVPRVL